MYRLVGGAALVGAFGLSVGPPAAAQAAERCYGVSPVGQGAGRGDAAAPGSGAVAYQGDVWALVPTGACLTLALPAQPDGTPRRGSYEPLDRDRP